MVLKTLSPYSRTVKKIQQMHWQEKFNNHVKFWLGRDSDRSTREICDPFWRRINNLLSVLVHCTHCIGTVGKNDTFISVVDLLPSNSFSLIRACIWWSVGLSPTMRIACLSCVVDMRPFLSCPKYSKTSRYSGNTNDWIVRENQIFSYIGPHGN